ncbi:helix-turn-helix transcriptional regulator [Streptomyces sp. CBMA156]|uniref:helix-turn-helix transcriptional regulator n=1 Tax=Streptomyces sp. CBMA156 TaxID=1930280 RepID=UPI001661FF14|nr:helix-turn-helix transcriptional regulator [Streptomyces sp. CBMA156]MBD0675638.1 hypothetical protein [Streptomyces sp. CBMA156]
MTDTSPVRGWPCPTCGHRIRLTQREHGVLMCTVSGATAPRTAELLRLSLPVVEAALRSLRAKTGARNTCHLISHCVGAGLIPKDVPAPEPGPVTARQRTVVAMLAEGLTAREAATAIGALGVEITENLVFVEQKAVRHHLQVPTVPAALALLYHLGELPRRHPCAQPACVRERLKREQDPDKGSGTAEDVLWAATVAEVARRRLEIHRARDQLATTAGLFTDALAELDEAQHQAGQALEEVKSLRGRAVANAAGVWAVADDLGEVRRQSAAALAEVAQLRRETAAARAELERNRVELTLDRAELAKERGMLARSWLELVAAREQARAALPEPDPEDAAGRPPARLPIPPEVRPWHTRSPSTP